ncbi:MAG: LamG domain-containing protein [Lachnospiraceae bacterium]
MNKDNVINVISVKQMGYLLLNDEEMDMSWEKPFSFVLQFRTLTFPDYVVLFEKKDFMKAELVGGMILVSGNGLIERAFAIFEDEFTGDDVKTISFVYKDYFLRIMYGSNVLMTMEVKEEGLPSNGMVNKNPIRIAGYLGGYLYYARLFGQALFTHEIANQMNVLYLDEHMDGLKKQLSAMHGEITCQPGNNKFDVNECYAVNIVPVYSFHKFGNIIAPNDSLVNPGGVAGKGYTVSALVYFRPEKQMKYYIFSNHEDSADSGMALYLEKSQDGNYYAVSEYGNCCKDLDEIVREGRGVRSREPIQIGEWVEITTTSDGSVLRLYVNGVKSSEVNISSKDCTGQGSNIIIGDSNTVFDMMDNINFSGYIKNVYVFDEALTEKECTCVDMELSYQKETLVGAYEAQSFQDKNQVSAADLFLSRGVKSLFIENTYPMEDLTKNVEISKMLPDSRAFTGYQVARVWHTRENGKVIFKYLCPYRGEIIIDEMEGKGMSDETVWMIELILTVVVGVGTCLIGLRVSPSGRHRITNNLVKLIENPYMRTAIQLLCRDVNWNSIMNVFRVIYQTGFLRSLLFSLFELSFWNVLSVACEILSWVIGVSFICVGYGLFFICANVVGLINRKPSIKLLSIQFCHTPKEPTISSVYIRSDLEKKEPDYHTGTNMMNNVLYLSDSVNGGIYIVGKFKVSGETVYEVSAQCESERMYNTDQQTISKRQKEGNFTFLDFRDINRTAGRKQITLCWKASGGGTEVNLGETRHMVYLLPQKPLEPIKVEEEDKYNNPYCQILDIFFDYRARNAQARLELADFAHAIYENPTFVYDGGNYFTRMSGLPGKEHTINLLIDQLVEELTKYKANPNGNKVKTNCTGIATIMYYFVCMFMPSKTNFKIMAFWNGDRGEKFKCQNIKPIVCEEAADCEFTNHYVLVNTDNQANFSNYIVYDACLKYQKLEVGDSYWVRRGEFMVPVDVIFGNGNMVSYISNLVGPNYDYDFKIQLRDILNIVFGKIG